LSGRFSSLLLNAYESPFPTIDFSASFMNKMNGALLLSLKTTWKKIEYISVIARLKPKLFKDIVRLQGRVNANLKQRMNK